MSATIIRAAAGEARAALSPHELAFYGDGARLLVPENAGELCDIVRQCEARFTPLVPAGLGAHAFAGRPPPPQAAVVSLCKLNRVLRYEPGDFTIGVEAGLSLAELRQTLLANDQEVPIDFPLALPGTPAARAGGTVGGFVARAPSGVRRARHGALRGFVIGVHGLRGGAGEPSRYKTGGMVVKNVAGYEVMKLLVGSLGTLGPILEVNFKLRPLPQRRLARVARFSSRVAAWSAAQSLRQARLEPACTWVLEGGDHGPWPAGIPDGGAGGTSLLWMFEGLGERVAWQDARAEELVRAAGPETDDVVSGAALDGVFDGLADFASPGALPRDDLGIVRISSLPSAAAEVAGHAAQAVGEAGFAAAIAADAECGLVTVRWQARPGAAALEQPLAPLAALVERHNASGAIAYLPAALRRRLPAELRRDPNAAHSRKLLRVFDPNGIFSPGRIVSASDP